MTENCQVARIDHTSDARVIPHGFCRRYHGIMNQIHDRRGGTLYLLKSVDLRARLLLREKAFEDGQQFILSRLTNIFWISEIGWRVELVATSVIGASGHHRFVFQPVNLRRLPALACWLSSVMSLFHKYQTNPIELT